MRLRSAVGVGEAAALRATGPVETRKSRAVRALALGAALLVAAACSPPQSPVQIGGPSYTAGGARFDVVLAPDVVAGTLAVTLDGEAVTASFSPTPWGASAVLAVTPGVSSTLEASAQFVREGSPTPFSAARVFTAPVPAPALLSSDPADAEADVPRTAWMRLEFAAELAPTTRETFALHCGSGSAAWTPQAFGLHAIGDGVVVVNPAAELPAGAQCGLSWQGGSGLETLLFATAASGAPAQVRYDRTQTRPVVPYPDDFYLVDDPSKPTGVRLAVPTPTGPSDVQFLFDTLRTETNQLDGFSPIAHIVVELSDAPDVATLPQSPAESLDPLATVAIFDLSPGATLGRRVPFRLEPRSDTSVIGVVSHSLLIFPSVPLTPGGRFGLVVSRRALVSPSRPFGPSPFFAAALAPGVPGEGAAVTKVRPLAADVLAVAGEASPPFGADDVALAVRISVRSTDDVPDDLRAVRTQVEAAPPPGFTITKVTAETSPTSTVAAVVEGTWQAPDYRSNGFFVRDAQGVPVRQATRNIPFILALPKASLQGPVPITMYQHGNPGEAETEVPSQARRTLAGAGFAVIGFTDPINREVAPGETDTVAKITAQVFAIFLPLTQFQRIPDYWVQTNAEQLAFLRMIPTLGTIDVLPVGAPDGVPDLAPALPLTYVGISEGANHGPGLLPYAPEIRAAALVVGGRRFTEVLIHQQAQTILSQIGGFFSNVTPAEIWSAISLFQGVFDVQDEHNHARFIYRDPFPVAGTTQRASILVIEGLEDSLVPNHATDSLAYELGPVPHLGPVQRPVPFLEVVTGPLVGNIDATTSAGFFQYVPTGVPGIPPTPGCAALTPSRASEGHYCAQSAVESIHQREVFFQSALTGVPRIIDPFSE